MTQPGETQPGEPPLPAIDSYRRAADAMRDTTKWLTAVVPGVGLVALVAHFAPALARRDSSDHRFWWALVLLVVALGAAGWIVRMAVGVFAVEVPGWGEAVRRADPGTDGPVGTAATSLAESLDADGVIQLYGYRRASELFADVSGAVLAHQVPSARAVAAGAVVVDYAAFRAVRVAFRRFLAQGAIAVILGIVALGAAEAVIDRAPVDRSLPGQNPTRPASPGVQQPGLDGGSTAPGGGPQPPSVVGRPPPFE